ncbi:two-component system histidine kinase PnpS [Fusibacter sp. 3D3]|uniref:two-component system histidine kinase PnpS n=1 Tax=Fusibacter sp. 3D3 TaxID=1048380 RepID=UPI0008528E03|nr:ATP-binding protein [Fusibacter sp. 3D3]GAU77656.1 phosphate regulon sensor protein PhoR [Fusibacter sp. 3D3]
MRKKILGTFIIIITVLTLSFVMITNNSLISAMLIQHETNLTNEVRLTENLLKVSYHEAFDFQGFCEEIKQSINARVTIINSEGVVLADSDEVPELMNNHLNRAEIIETNKTGQPETAKRFSNTLNTDSLYVAKKTTIEGVNYFIRISEPLVDIDAITKAIRSYSMLVIIFTALMAILISFIITRRITKSLYQLTEMSNLISNGEYGKKIYNQSKDQIGLLTDSFNLMSKNLERSINEITSRNSELESILNSMINGIIAIDKNRNILMINKISFEILNLPEDYVVENESMYKIIRNDEIAEMVEISINQGVSQIKEIQYVHLDKILRIYINPIRTANDENIGSIVVIQDVTQIRKLEQMRSDFVSNVSHELKTPLTSIKGFVDTLKQGAINDHDTAMRFLDIIEIESDRLHRLITDILLLSEIESMDRDSEYLEANLKAVLEEVFEMLKSKADEKNIALKFSVERDYIISANRDRIKQMFINLIDNAVKYTEKGQVQVTIVEKNPWIQILVKDTGIGFSEVHKERLFERFYRVDKGRSRSQGGTGLGLSIVKHIVLLYKGKISVESTPGQGTTFEILLPNKSIMEKLNK